MLCDGRHKYIHYVGDPPQLFDLVDDPEEVRDLSALPECQPLVVEFEGRLRSMLDPEAVDTGAKADQTAKVEAFGGEDAVRRRGTFDNSPAPGEAPSFRHYG